MNKIAYLLIGLSFVIGITIGTSTNVIGQQTSIPSWVKNTALWWGQGQISDSEFIKAIQWLINNGILIPNESISTQPQSTNPAQSSNTITNSPPVTISVLWALGDKIDASSSNVIYIYDVDFVNNDNRYHSLDTAGFQLITEGNSVYLQTEKLSLTQALQNVNLAPNQHATGEIAFELPSNEIPSLLEYQNSVEFLNNLHTNLPTPSTWVSNISYVEANEVVEVGHPLFFSVHSSDLFGVRYNSGNPITVTLDGNFVGLPDESMKINSITVTDQGFQVTSVSPSLPITLDHNTSSIQLKVNLLTPSYSYNGNLHFNVNVSGQ